MGEGRSTLEMVSPGAPGAKHVHSGFTVPVKCYIKEPVPWDPGGSSDSLGKLQRHVLIRNDWKEGKCQPDSPATSSVTLAKSHCPWEPVSYL